MRTLVSTNIAILMAGLLFQIQAFTDKLPNAKDTYEHAALSRLGWFLLVGVAMLFIIKRYIHVGYTSSKVARTTRLLALIASTIFMCVVLGIRVIGLDILTRLPKSITNLADLWYAIPLSIGINLLVLLLIQKK